MSLLLGLFLFRSEGYTFFVIVVIYYDKNVLLEEIRHV